MTTPSSPIDILAKHARGEIHHLNAGLCPDGIEGSITRDDECPVCQALQALADKHSSEPRITLSLSLGKAKALGLLNLQAGVHAICEGDLIDRFSLLIGEDCAGGSGTPACSIWVRLDGQGSPMLGTARHDKPTYERWEDHNWVMLSNRLQPAPEFMRKIARQVATQNCRGTDRPLFAVMQKTEMVTLESHDHDRIIWIDTQSGDYLSATRQKAHHLEKLHAAGEDTPGWQRYAVKDIDEFVTACFSEEGCKQYLAKNGHNLRQPFIYAFGSHRNAEWRDMLNFLTMINQGQA